MLNTKQIVIGCLFCILGMSAAGLFAQMPAFPGAEGAGMYTTGGRGGEVYYVNTLEDSIVGNKETKEGSLRWCLKRPGPRVIMFKVGGIIDLKSPLSVPANTTIAGQSAPGDGICISGNTVKLDGDNIIVRYMRFRLGDKYDVQDDALKASKKKNLIIDHCSMSWAVDECASFYDNENFTMQWCIISESLRASKHSKGAHGYGGIWGGQKATFHHNLLAHHDSRNPRMCGSRYSNEPELEKVDFRNNVIYNWGSNSAYGGEGGQYNIVNNYYKPSKASSNRGRIFAANADDGKNKQEAGVWGQFYVDGNYVDGDIKVTENNMLGINAKGAHAISVMVLKEFSLAGVKTDSARDAYKKILLYGGASYKRDNTDARVVNEVKKGLAPKRASHDAGTKPGLIDSQEDVGGWDVYSYQENEVPEDSDIDGIPDGWLESNYPGKKSTDFNEEGYTYLEVYLNQLVQNITKNQAK
ncbi:polysaccharide lyase family 1 protein [Dysgonomonas sp. 520]|uniref:pectate lyase family protein n=1 Tax=Dysgonomonas sp. 520 TaxID=2302931 RepID=UPI0013D1847F|nr:pectate lyase [Dysgonomonas sp. 520]NDW10236.1 pectate lyase [Dysgonomonas sp. 520]